MVQGGTALLRRQNPGVEYRLFEDLYLSKTLWSPCGQGSRARQNLSTINFMAAFAKTSSSCNSTLEKCQHSLKSSFKKVKSQIQKGANPEKAARCGYEEACEYLEIGNKTILIQQRALACLTKSLAHVLQREFYTMGNTGLLRRKAEMTLLQPHLGDTRAPLIHSGYKALHKEQALTVCIQSLLSKNAIERVENVKSLGFYSRLFLVPKPHQRWRPVIDLSRLNAFLLVVRFKMETPDSIRASLIPGEWVSSIDLSEAYLHITIHPNSRKYLRFCHKSQITSLPFRLATAPQVFTTLVKEVKLMALTRGISLHQYLDD